MRYLIVARRVDKAFACGGGVFQYSNVAETSTWAMAANEQYRFHRTEGPKCEYCTHDGDFFPIGCRFDASYLSYILVHVSNTCRWRGRGAPLPQQVGPVRISFLGQVPRWPTRFESI